MEVQLYIRQIAAEHFRQYTLVAENSVSARSQSVLLRQSKSTRPHVIPGIVLTLLFNPFNASCSKLLLFEGFGAILV